MKIILIFLLVTIVLSKPIWRSSFTALVRPVFEGNGTQMTHYYHHHDFANNRYRHTIVNTYAYRIYKCDAKQSDFIRYNLYYCHATCLKGKDCNNNNCGCTALNFEKLVQESVPGSVNLCAQGYGYVNRASGIEFCFNKEDAPKFYREIAEKMRYDVFDYVAGVPDPNLFAYSSNCKCEPQSK